MRAMRLAKPPVIDGVLDDEAWTGAPLPAGTWLSYNPLHGEQAPQQTTVWVGYDADALYFAFRCDDPDPGGIKTSITRRDNIWSDDWVGLSLDALGTGSVSYHLMVNPSGIQLDMINTIAGYEDTSPDWIWDSAGPRQRSRLRRGDPTAAAVHPVQGRRGREHGHPVLASRQPHGHVGRLARARAGQVGVRETREAGVLRPSGPADTRDDPVGDLLASPGARDAVGLGRRRPHRGPRDERQVGPDIHGDPGRDGEPRFQPGGKRRVPGGGQPALSRVLLREAALLHGGRRAVQPGGQRPGRRVDALRRQHAQHRRSDLRRQAHGVGRARDLWRADGGRPGAGADRLARRSADGQGEVLSDRARADEPEARQLRRRPGDVHQPVGPHQRRRRRRRQPEVQGITPGLGVCPGLDHRRRRADRSLVGRRACRPTTASTPNA